MPDANVCMKLWEVQQKMCVHCEMATWKAHPATTKNGGHLLNNFPMKPFLVVPEEDGGGVWPAAPPPELPAGLAWMRVSCGRHE